MTQKRRKKHFIEAHTGIMLSEPDDNQEMQGTCPFCHGPNFYVGKDHQWECKHKNKCGKEGNQYTFIEEWLKECTDDVTKLAESKSIKPDTLLNLGVRYNQRNDTYVIPTTRKGKINNLLKMDLRSNTIFSYLPQTLYNIPLQEEMHDTVWLVEGHKDKWAGDEITEGQPITVVGFPGSAWKKWWRDEFSGKHVIIIADNDKAGEDYVFKISRSLQSAENPPAKISRLVWPPSSPKKADLRDKYIELGDKTLSWVHTNIDEVRTMLQVVKGDDTASFDQFIERAKQYHYITPDVELALLLVFCAIHSIPYGGEQIWIRLIGPPGCGKSSIASFISESSVVEMQSTFTGLFSGYETDNGEDASLAALLGNRLLCIKDADALYQQQNVAQTLSEFRDWYDRQSDVFFKNSVNHRYKDMSSGVILMGTIALRDSDNTSLGERFMDFEMKMNESQKELVVQKAMQIKMDQFVKKDAPNPEKIIQKSAIGLIDTLASKEVTLDGDVSKLLEVIRLLGRTIAVVRTQVKRNKRGQVTHVPEPEVPTRITGQLLKVMVSSTQILESTEDPRIAKLISSIAAHIMDTRSPRYRLLEALSKRSHNHVVLAQILQLDEELVMRELEDLYRLKVISPKKDALVDLAGKPILVNGAQVTANYWLVDEKIKQGFLLCHYSVSSDPSQAESQVSKEAR